MAENGRRTLFVVLFVVLSLIGVAVVCGGLATIGGLTVLGNNLQATFDEIENGID